VPRFLVTTQRALRGRVATAEEAVRDTAGVTLLDARNPDMVSIETTEEIAQELKRRLAATHFVDPETHHRLH